MSRWSRCARGSCRDNEREIFEKTRRACQERYGKDIDELNLRKALLAREMNESKVWSDQPPPHMCCTEMCGVFR